MEAREAYRAGSCHPFGGVANLTAKLHIGPAPWLSPDEHGWVRLPVHAAYDLPPEPEDDSPITFTIRTRSVDLVSLERGEGADSPADVDEAVEMALSWLAADVSPAAFGLLQLAAANAPLPARPRRRTSSRQGRGREGGH